MVVASSHTIAIANAQKSVPMPLIEIVLLVSAAALRLFRNMQHISTAIT
jgi:hypothetical protein